ncbi:GNAT family N-acetyltransferase [Halobacillus yeomjeoni]|uniref:GNAT family N-acetyltransferase n=1 Tax=Halobacillus yeomjeoni TaxID=311194 RepID=A0A931HVZ3_9BACI|nr:GNAT family N-acetyltransferase [Halobacillus yeomjeoni]MBH0230498.1 GNAT family N-acetyltransferase [Halobacillus yeomjeoni]
MKIIRNEPLDCFLEEVESLLLQNEAANNLPIGILNQMKQDPSKLHLKRIRIADGNTTVFLALRTPPHYWILPFIKSMNPQHIRLLTTYLKKHDIEVPGVLGEERAVDVFVQEWQDVSSCRPELHMKQGIYRLRHLSPLKQQEGSLVEAGQADKPLVKQWLIEFGKQTNELIDEDRAQELAAQMVEAKRVHFLKRAGVYVSMVCRARETPNGATINGVFTPDQYKKKGYATQSVWALTKKLLDEGKSFCALYTDMENPTSNSIYRKIGYEWIGSSIVYKFIQN